jgi:thioredoxin reductase (NADPH)
LFIAGELGGMGLIRNAIEQGRQAMESIKAFCAGA